MAFRMNRSIIKGTANHKASIAKAKAKPQSIVAQTRTQADAGLVTAADYLGKSFNPGEIEYEKDMDAFKVSTKDDKVKVRRKKKKKDKPKKEKDNSLKVSKKTKRADKKAKKLSNEYDSYVKYMQGQRLDNQIISGDDWLKLSKRERKKLTKVDKDNIFEKAYKGIREKIRIGKENIEKKKKQNELDFQIEQEEKNKAKAEKEAAKLEADKLKQAELDKKEIEKALALERRNEEKLKKRLIREEAEWRRKNKRKKSIIEVEEPITEGIGDQQIRQYTKEQRERLNTEGEGRVWSNDLGRYVLSEEIVDGEFVSRAEGTKLDIYDKSKDVKTEPVVEEKKTLSNLEIRKKKAADKKWNDPKTGQYVKDQMLKEGYVPNEGKSPATMRDDRIYRNAIKGGVIRKNMIKSGYIPPN